MKEAREKVREECMRTWEGPSHRVRRGVKRASVLVKMRWLIVCGWLPGSIWSEFGSASRPLRVFLLIMAVGAVGTSLTTERTLLIRRHVTAHPCRVNTLHCYDYTLFLSHTHKHTQILQLCMLSVRFFFIYKDINMQIYKSLMHINTDDFMHTHTGEFASFPWQFDHDLCDQCSSWPCVWHRDFWTFPLATLQNYPMCVTDVPAISGSNYLASFLGCLMSLLKFHS